MRARVPRTALAGGAAAAVAGIAAVGLIALVAAALVSEPLGMSVLEPMAVFSALALSMAGGFALALFLFGFASWKTNTPSRAVAGLLIVGGLALLAPVGVEFVGLTFGIETPAWLLFPAIVLVALDALAIGYSLRTHPGRS